MNYLIAAVPRVSVELAGDVELEQLQSVVAQLYRESGCHTCGRLSFTINAIDPEVVLPALRELEGLEFVNTVHVS